MDRQSEILSQRLQEMHKEQLIISAVTMALAKVLDRSQLDTAFHQSLKKEFGCDEILIFRSGEKQKDFTVFYSTFLDQQERNDIAYHSDDLFIDECLRSAEPVVFDLKNIGDKKNSSLAKIQTMRTVVGFCLPKVDGSENVLFLFYKNYRTPEDIQERIIKNCSAQISITLRNIDLTEKLKPDEKNKESHHSEENILTQKPEEKSKGFNGIIGESKIMQQIYEQISQVAPSSSNVIIYGETGTGKELIAQAIHNLSEHSEKNMIRINCAAIPANLIESELFGHEKGSFTGATEQRKGKFEQAHNNTIFLDEIGELPLELQGRLLRVLQEKEVERIGGDKRIKVDARIIAATNRNLEQETAEGKFRSDLFYRLNVFPIYLPALRERREDIPLLAAYFLEKLYVKTGKKISGISPKVMNAMMQHHWRGNIRELEHTIERSMLTAKDKTIKEMEFPKTVVQENSEQEFQIKTLNEFEKEYILKIIGRCNGKIFGENGAAKLLGLPPTTLISKMQKLGIEKKHHFNSDQ